MQVTSDTTFDDRHERLRLSAAAHLRSETRARIEEARERKRQRAAIFNRPTQRRRKRKTA
jgi:hypothetical protein